MCFEFQLPGFVAVHHHTCIFQLITQVRDSAKKKNFFHTTAKKKTKIKINDHDNDNKIQWFSEHFGEAKIYLFSQMVLYEIVPPPRPLFEKFINKMYSLSHLLE